MRLVSAVGNAVRRYYAAIPATNNVDAVNARSAENISRQRRSRVWRYHAKCSARHFWKQFPCDCVCSGNIALGGCFAEIPPTSAVPIIPREICLPAIGGAPRSSAFFLPPSTNDKKIQSPSRKINAPCWQIDEQILRHDIPRNVIARNMIVIPVIIFGAVNYRNK